MLNGVDDFSNGFHEVYVNLNFVVFVTFTPMKGSEQYRGDPLSPTERSERMSRVRGKDTKPELMVRRLVHSMGFRYRLHRRDLPGSPDLVFPKLRKVIFVHGCFWHRHEGCPNNRTPKSKKEFWVPKLESNRVRDQLNQERLKQEGWECLVIWECELGNQEELRSNLQQFLNDSRNDIH